MAAAFLELLYLLLPIVIFAGFRSRHYNFVIIHVTPNRSMTSP